MSCDKPHNVCVVVAVVVVCGLFNLKTGNRRDL